MTTYTVISFPTCPFVQRVIIALEEKNIPYTVTYIDRDNKPDWFLAMAPLGKVPVLKVEREGGPAAILFESAAIVEYIEDVCPEPPLRLQDPLRRAEQRAWAEIITPMLQDQFRMMTGTTVEEYEEGRAAFRARLMPLETMADETGPYFSGAQFSYADAAFASVFRIIDVLDEIRPTGAFDAFPKVEAWANALAERPSVRKAAPAEYRGAIAGWVKNNGSVFSQVE